MRLSPACLALIKPFENAIIVEDIKMVAEDALAIMALAAEDVFIAGGVNDVAKDAFIAGGVNNVVAEDMFTEDLAVEDMPNTVRNWTNCIAYINTLLHWFISIF